MTSKNPKPTPTPTAVEPEPDPILEQFHDLADSIIDQIYSSDAEDANQADPIDEAAAPPVPAIEYVDVDPPVPSGVSVRFLQDYRGVITNEAYYTKDSVIVFDAWRAKQLIEQGRAVEVKVKTEE